MFVLQGEDSVDGLKVGQEAEWSYLSKFPKNAETGMREAITQGVRVRVGVGFIPQPFSPHGEHDEVLFAYRCALLT
jgi:hypothetical protein